MRATNWASRVHISLLFLRNAIALSIFNRFSIIKVLQYALFGDAIHLNVNLNFLYKIFGRIIETLLNVACRGY